MKRIAVCLALVGLLALGGNAFAVICTVDDVPAATLLLPYFEVDLDDGAGITTLFSINNASAAAALAHVVVWSDLSVPVLDFNVYLTGYDVQTINLRDVLNGNLPETADVINDPAGSAIGVGTSPRGPLSQDITMCADGQLPPGDFSGAFLTHVRNALTGGSSSVLGGCAGLDHGDNMARGYVTVDSVNFCTLAFPGDAGYFAAGGTGAANNNNILWGDYFYVEPGNNFAQGETLVHIEADALNPETSLAGEYTFYGRYVNWTAADNREPLATNFAARYALGGPFDGTDYIAWRDAKTPQGAFTCGTVPTWYPLGQEAIVFFDEQEQTVTPEGCNVSPCEGPEGIVPFPAETQRVAVGSGELPTPFNFGWTYMNLNHDAVTPVNEDPFAAQAWVTVVMSAEGRYSVGFNAIQLDSACNAFHGSPGGLNGPAAQ